MVDGDRVGGQVIEVRVSFITGRNRTPRLMINEAPYETKLAYRDGGGRVSRSCARSPSSNSNALVEDRAED